MIAKLIQLLKNFFGIPYSEARGLVILFSFLFLAVFIPVFLKSYYRSKAIDPIKIVPLTELKATESKEVNDIMIFAFDPNVISYDSLTLLGLEERIAARLLSYRNSGGTFRVKSDLLKIYDLPEEWYETVSDSILLPAKSPNKTVFSSKSAEERDWKKIDTTSFDSSPQVEEITIADLNAADTTDLKNVYGIGSVLSGRVVRFRERLGGFVSWQQLHEVYGLKVEVIEQMQKYFYIDKDFESRKIRINQATFKEVLAHPYVDYNQTKAIINYRDQHGDFEEISDLEAIHLLSDSVIVKLEPYLSFE